jgi:hypothetical protein
MQSVADFSGHLDTRVIRPRPHRVHSLRLGNKRLMFTDDPGDSTILANQVFSTNLTAVHSRLDGTLQHIYDLGSGLVTNIGVNLLANDWTLVTAPVLKTMNFHACGTGTTAAAASDYYLQTVTGSGSLTGSTNGYFTGTQSWVAPNIYKTTATFTYSASVAVTEWGLLNSNAANFSGTATSTGNNTLTNSGATFTTTGNGLTGWTVEASATAVNTPTTTAMGQVASNTGTVLTILGSSGSGQWLTLANASASNPSGTTGYVVYPSLWDHKVFSAINVVSGDSIQFIYSLTVNSGG